MRVGIIVEGKYDGSALKEICRRIGIEAKIRKQRGTINIRKASAYIKELFFSSVQKIVLLSDAHCNSEGERKRLEEIYKFVQDKKGMIHICIVVNELENWFLADEKILSDILRYRVKKN